MIIRHRYDATTMMILMNSVTTHVAKMCRHIEE